MNTAILEAAEALMNGEGWGVLEGMSSEEVNGVVWVLEAEGAEELAGLLRSDI